MNISRTPVIAAINRLVAEGLAESLPRRGTIVTQLTPKKIKDMCEARYMIELFVVNHAVNRIDSMPEVFEKMNLLARQLDEVKCSDYEYDVASQLDFEFHTLYVSLAQNEQISKMYQANWSIGTPYYILRLANMPLSNIKHLFGAHIEFVDFLMAKNQVALRKSLSKHLNLIQEVILDLINQNPLILEAGK